MLLFDRILLWSKFVAILALVVFYRFEIGSPIKFYPKTLHKTIFIDPHFSFEQRNDIVLAAAEWGVATKNVITFSIKQSAAYNDLGDDSIRIIKVTANDHLIEETEFVEKNQVLGFYEENDGKPFIVLVSERLDGPMFKAVVLHELGHAIGLKHNEGKQGVFTLMYPYVNLGSNTITDDDVTHVCELYDCSNN